MQIRELSIPDSYEITPKQLRALLLLLVLVPFIPMVLMLRFMTDALESERDAAWERIVTTNHRALLNAARDAAQTGLKFFKAAGIDRADAELRRRPGRPPSLGIVS